MGCTLWRMELFRRIPPTWFVTVSDWFPEQGGVAAMTQDLHFCRKAREAGGRFAVDCRVKVGYLDPATGIVYYESASPQPFVDPREGLSGRS